jgi:2'-5' RNA ligase
MYQQLWAEALAAFARGQYQLDAHLPDKAGDLRRGVSLALRPSPEVLAKLKSFTDQLAALCPGQYFYQPAELHVTVLSLISGTIAWRKEIRHLAAYRKIVDVVLARQSPFNIEFRGLTASPSAIMIQGFVPGDELNQLRSDLRTAFTQNGFANALDRRYKIITAHITVMRFQQPGLDLKTLVPFLKAHRETDFGEMTARQLQLTWGDWYASTNVVRILEKYPLGSAIRQK